jgi:VanZ family protein
MVPWLVFAGFTVFIVFVVYAANTGQGGRYWSFLDAIPYGDKLGHVLLMGTLCLLLNLALRCRTVGRVLLGSVIIAVIVLGEELSQIFIATRTFDFGDLLADSVGILLASWLAMKTVRRKR